ncbi:DUF6680 family protein [uncultured Sphingomonas sp.]|uniref:DUF6680 family protein n=1 Tax=uncultured Sphingomonas sp. TaxID=158754 RepID=UPI0035CBF826
MAGTVVAEAVFKVSDAAVVAATLVGPILAVQAQKWLERGRAVRERRVAIFRALMATRAARLSPAHVEAINAVPVEFYGRSVKLKTIVDDWHTYLGVLANRELAGEIVFVERQRAFLDMLHKMSTYLGYNFNRTELEKDVYYPEGHKIIEDDNDTIRRGFASLLKGELALPMAIKEFPFGEDAGAEQEALRKLFIEWLSGRSMVKVEGI